MDMNYGCDVSNRYTGYLDSSDHGNSMSSSTNKNKRKTKKKRKSKNQKSKVDIGINTENVESEEVGGKLEAQPPKSDSKDDQNDGNESLVQDNFDNSIDGLSSLPSCDSPIQRDPFKEATENDENKKSSNDLIIDGFETKWSVICFEEEKNLKSPELSADDKILNEPEMAFKEQRIYPTVYFYNSSFGNKNRRVVYNNNHDRNHRSQNNNNNNQSINQTNEVNQKKRWKRNVRRRKNVNDNETHDTSEIHSIDEKQIDSNNQSIDRASQHTDETNSREHSMNHYNKHKHGMSQRTFSRRRTDFVRNV